MHEKYMGKTCPYCKTPFVEGDTVVFCSVCDMPHHLSCWQDNQGCTTFGCTGTIKEIIGNPYDTVAAQPEPQPAPAAVAPAPVETPPAPAEKPIETLYHSSDMVFMSDVPIVLENAAIIIDRTKDKLFAQCAFQVIADKSISAVMVEISCQDVWGSTLGEPISYQYLDLKTERGTKFGSAEHIDLPDRTTRKISIQVKKVLYADGAVACSESAAFTTPSPALLSQHLGSEELAAEYARETTPDAKFVPTQVGDYWLCACGCLNAEAEETCYHCSSAREQLTAALDPDALQANMLAFAADKKAAEEKAKAEQEERIRQAEEQVKKEQEKLEHDLWLVKSMEQKKKRRKKAIVLISVFLAVAILIGCGVVFFGIPYYNYRLACDALETGDYDYAIEMFESLDGFMDSEDQVLEAKYRKAEKLQNNKVYFDAYKLYSELGNYKESKDELLVTVTLWEAAALGSSSTTMANTFAKTVKLTSDQYELFYGTILLFLNGHENASYWFDWGGTTASKNTLTMLKLLPSSYKDTNTLLKLFNLLAKEWGTYGELFADNESLMRKCWSLAFVQDLAEQDGAISYFLRGYWTGSGYYLSFDEENYSSFDLPWVSKPRGTKYYDIEDMIYYWDGENSNHLAKVFRFEIVNYDTIRVYCYKNNRTYTLYR